MGDPQAIYLSIKTDEIAFCKVYAGLDIFVIM
jgi:hypothetical protein